ncbi:hypothetical protein [Archangium primigenium]|uniref:hypothetical protein n=1 Tax=[Archangium] primigenium TaxID=2792470 RepID=UPI00195687D4|nr:hypothetical protein [Archangium primigenium]MBM7112991.1 hypothetical protein [Archangium primigenium]
MKKLLTALVVTLSTAAIAEQPMPQSQAEQQNEKNQTSRVSTGVDATQVGPAIKDTAKDVGQKVSGTAEEAKEGTERTAERAKEGVENTADKAAHKAGLALASDGTFKREHAFSARGTLKNTGGGGVTLVRQGLPDANLDVRPETIVMLDGKKVESNAIPEGSQVRARFQLEGEEIVAVELNATSPKAHK